MLDIRFIRENISLIRDNLKLRKDENKLKDFDRLLEMDAQVRGMMKEIQDLRTKRNKLSREIGELKKAGQDDSKLVKQVNKVNAKIKSLEAEKGEIQTELRRIQMSIPNILHESVPFGEDDEDNEVVREWGGKPEFNFEYHSHVDLLNTLGVGDIPRAAKIAGSRFYYLKNELVLLDIAMQQMALEMLLKKGYSPVYPPFMMRREPYEGVTDLADFEDVMYKIEGEDLYLIATSEHPLSARRCKTELWSILTPTSLRISILS